MAPYPTSVRALCEELDVEVPYLILNCVFCKRWLSATDKWSFDQKALKLVWRKGYPYAVCGLCLHYELQISWWRRFRRSAYGQTVENETSTPLGDLLVRCYKCSKPLVPEEKSLMLEDNIRFYDIGGHWRGVCVMCSAGVFF
ncbi:E6 [Ailuropoda melanoleuca papillomavirus 2]|uniref:Protein E6 n=1 Tax=Ailuropoda melanoleuca papillomavirus 2 TaxID=2016455 RepID=A0A220IGF3_9PAPI|nr:E6 [Ailuropoda melanoleuca papillomavirus 2]ASH99057.1 E6 [Ailuropoda melanoleuca papillomavirus 2]